MRQTKIFSLHLFRHDVRSNLPLILVVLLIMILMANVVNFAMSLMAAEKIPQEVEDNQEDFFKYLAVMGVYNEKADVEKRQYKVQWKAQKKALSKAEKALGDVDVAVVDAESELDQSAAVLKKRARAMKKATKKQQKAAADMQKKAVAAGIAKVTGQGLPEAGAAAAKSGKKVKRSVKALKKAQKKLERATRSQTEALVKYSAVSAVQTVSHESLEKQREAVTELREKYEDARDRTKHKATYDDFCKASPERLAFYDDLFADATEDDEDGFVYSRKGLKKLAKIMETSPVSMDKYVQEFEYVFALAKSKGTFSGEELDLEDMMTNTLEINGVSTSMVDSMGELDMTYMLNRVYFTVMGLLPIFLLIVILANTLVAGQVDNGSMAYILSTPTRRSAVTITHIAFLVLIPLVMVGIVCLVRMGSNRILYGEMFPERTAAMYAGLYLLVEAVAGLCFLGSCIFNKNRQAMAFGGGLTVWFFLASLLGLFGAKNLVDMGVGVARLDIFNKMTLVGLFDVEALNTVGSESVDTGFLWKLGVLAAVAVVCYVAGAVRFSRKDLPL